MDLVSTLFHFQCYVEASPVRMESGGEQKLCAQDQHCKGSCMFWVAVERYLVVERTHDDSAVVAIVEFPRRVCIAD